MKASITALSTLSVFLACLVVSSAHAQEPEKAPPTTYKVADVDGGAISLDGRYLSYTDWSTGDLALQDLKTMETRPLTNKGSWLESPAFAQWEQAFSPDGRQVAYAWQIESGLCELRIVGLDGSAPRVLYRSEEITGIAVEDWSPDGKHILATFQKKDRTSQTVLVSVADSSVRVLKAHANASRMIFSPDGQWIVYNFAPEEDRPERYDIYLLTSDGNGGTPLVEHPANDIVLGWAPDGKSVLFVSDRAGTSGAWVIQVVDGQPGGAPELVRPDMPPIAAHWIGLTRDGASYFGQSAWVSDVYVATLDPATGTLGPPEKLVSHVGPDTSPDWSPDGRYLAYAFDRGSEFDTRVLGIHAVQTGEERHLRLTMPRVHAFQPHWSPDGRSLLAQGRALASTLPGVEAFYRIDAQSGEITPLLIRSLGPPSNNPDVTRGEMEWPVWSADGKAIIYRRSDTANDEQSLVVRDLETSGERELYRGNPRLAEEHEQSTVPAEPTEMYHEGYVGASSLAVSPDGQQVAFVWSTPTSWALKVIPTTAGDEPLELLRVQPPERLFQPAWMPDGRRLLFGKGLHEGQDPRLELWLISAAGGEPHYLGLAMEGLLLYGLSIHPAGQRIAFTAGRRLGSQTWVTTILQP